MLPSTKLTDIMGEKERITFVFREFKQKFLGMNYSSAENIEN